MTDAIGTRPVAAPRIVELAARPAAVVRIEGTVADLPRLIGEAFGLTAGAITASGATIAGPPFARYLAFGGRIEAEVGFPFEGRLVPTERVFEAKLPGGRAVTVTHVGPYDEIGSAWERAQAWMGHQGVTPSGPGWEAYLTGPDEPGPPVTEIYFPLG